MLTKSGINKIAMKVHELIKGVRIIFIDGYAEDLPLYESTVEGDFVNVLALLHQDVVGETKSIELIDAEGEVLASKSYQVKKDDGTGILVSYKFRVVEQEVQG